MTIFKFIDRKECSVGCGGSAGQGLVAFATGALDRLDYAVKFFLHRPSFQAERALYKSQTLGKLLPQVCTTVGLSCDETLRIQ